MKYWIFILLFPLSFCSVGASFLYQEIDPECLLDGTTKKFSAVGVSDTSSWRIPTLYMGECKEVIDLSGKEKDFIYERFYLYFDSKGYLEERFSYKVLSDEGVKFVENTYFPLLKKLLLAEHEKENPNDRKIAIYRYAAHIIGYDYGFLK